MSDRDLLAEVGEYPYIVEAITFDRPHKIGATAFDLHSGKSHEVFARRRAVLIFVDPSELDQGDVRDHDTLEIYSDRLPDGNELTLLLTELENTACALATTAGELRFGPSTTYPRPKNLESVEFESRGVAVSWYATGSTQAVGRRRTRVVRPNHEDLQPLVQDLLRTACALIDTATTEFRNPPDTIGGSR